MKIPLFTPALVAILGFALAGAPITSQAQTSTNAAPASAPAPAAKHGKLHQYEGSITAIDDTSVTVTSTKKTLTLAISPSTTFKKDKKPATLADFALGDKVTGSYSKDATGAMTAHSLNKKTPKIKAVPAAAVPTTPAPEVPAVPAPATPSAQ
ncbi:MAG: DUF5666 domain-containing protein [Methylacidiphilales bacterium]|nr:DUF5666 domain-containing protein [Candidatus Methylacidiphilales bacterium]